MWSKQSRVFVCAILVVLFAVLALILQDEPDGGQVRTGGSPETEHSGVSVEKVTPVVAPTPEPLLSHASEETTKGTSVLFRMTWKSNDLPVESALLNLVLPKSGVYDNGGAAQVSGKSDASGMVEVVLPIDKSASGDIMLQVSVDHPDAKPLIKMFRSQYLINKGYGRTGLIRLEKDCGVSGTVYWRPSGSKYVPAPGATVAAVENVRLYSSTMQQKKDNEFVTITDAEGRYDLWELPPGPRQVWARLNDYVSSDRPKPLALGSGVAAKKHDIYLEHGIVLSALVSDKESLTPINGAIVSADYGEGNFSQSVTTDRDGFCEISGLPIGPVWLTVRAKGYAIEQIPTEVLPDENSEIPIFLGKGGKVQIKTIKLIGEGPEPNVSVEIKSPSQWLPIVAVTNSEGVVEVDGVPVSANVTIKVQGEYTGWTRKIIAVSEDKTATATLRLKKTVGKRSVHRYPMQYHTIEGTVVDEAGVPVPSALVFNKGCCPRQTATNATGEFHLEGVHLRVFPMDKEPFEFKSTVPESIRKSMNPRKIDSEELFFRGDGYVTKDGQVVSYFVSPALIGVEAQGFTTVPSTAAAVHVKTKIVLPDKSKGEITGRVLDEMTRKPVQDYRIHVSFGSPMIVKRVISKSGSFAVSGLYPDKSYPLRIESEGYVTKRISRESKDNGEDILLEPLDFSNVVVMDGETGEPVPNVKVRHLNSSPRNDWSAYLNTYNDFSYIAEYVTDKNGIFTLKQQVNSGELLFMSPKHKLFSIPVNTLGNYRDTESGIIIITIFNPTAVLSANFVIGTRFLDKEEATLSLEYIGSSTTEQPKKPKPLYENGIWKWGNLDEGKYRLTGRHTVGDMRQFVETIDLAQSEQKHLSLGKGYPGSISGHVRKPNGTPFPSVIVVFTSDHAFKDRNYFSATTAPDGSYQSVYLPIGQYNVMLFSGPDGKRDLEGKWPTVNIQEETVQDFTAVKNAK